MCLLFVPSGMFSHCIKLFYLKLAFFGGITTKAQWRRFHNNRGLLYLYRYLYLYNLSGMHEAFLGRFEESRKISIIILATTALYAKLIHFVLFTVNANYTSRPFFHAFTACASLQWQSFVLFLLLFQMFVPIILYTTFLLKPCPHSRGNM